MNLFSLRKHNELAKAYLDRSLMNRIRLFIVIFLLMLVLIGYDIYDGTIGPVLSLAGFAVGLGIGFIISRIFKIHWHESLSKIAFRIDRMGTIILVIYSIFTILRNQIFGQFVNRPQIWAFVFAFLAGVFLGRLLSMYSSIKKILVEKGIVIEN